MKRQDASEPSSSKKFKWNPDDTPTIPQPPVATASTPTTTTATHSLQARSHQPTNTAASSPGALPSSAALSPDATAALASYYAYYYPHLFGTSSSLQAAGGTYPNVKSYAADTSSLPSHHQGYHHRPSHAYGYAQPHLASPAASMPASSSSRSIYLGNVPPSTTFEDIFNLIHHGIVDAVRRLVEKNCAFIDFVDPHAAASFLADYSARGLSMGGQTIKVSYASGSSATNPAVTLALSSGGSRVLYLCQLLSTHTHPSPPVVAPSTDYLNPEWLRRNLCHFGEIESIKVLSDKKTSFVYFTSILTAVSAVANLSGDPRWQGLKISYGKDRCAPGSASHLNATAGPFLMHAASSSFASSSLPLPLSLSSSSSSSSPSSLSYMASVHAAASTAANASTNLPAVTIYPGPTLPGVPVPFTSDHRTLFLGSLPATTTLSDLANAIRGGALYNLKILEEKHCAFVTFIDAEAAYAFYAAAIGPAGVFTVDAQGSLSSFNTNTNVAGVAVHGRKITKIGFSKPFPLTLSVADMIQYDKATRTLYLTPSTVAGSSVSRELPSMADVRAMFEPFGPLESINLIPGKNVMFINYANLLSAVKALAALKDAGRGKWRLYYGRDRSATAFVPNRSHHGMKQEAVKLDATRTEATGDGHNAVGLLKEDDMQADDAHDNPVDNKEEADDHVESKAHADEQKCEIEIEDVEALLDAEHEVNADTENSQNALLPSSFEDLETFSELEATLSTTVESLPPSK